MHLANQNAEIAVCILLALKQRRTAKYPFQGDIFMPISKSNLAHTQPVTLSFAPPLLGSTIIDFERSKQH